MNGCTCDRRHMGSVMSLPCRECRPVRTTTYQCDYPPCVEMVEDSTQWWHVRIAKGAIDWTPLMFDRGYRHDLHFCSPSCMQEAFRLMELTEIARDA